MVEHAKREIIPLAARYVAMVGTLVFLSSLAFSKKSRREILERDDYQCTADGLHIGGLEASHLSHKKDDNYDDPDNGVIFCTRHHLIQHRDSSPKSLGMTRAHNRSAIRLLAQRLNKYIIRDYIEP